MFGFVTCSIVPIRLSYVDPACSDRAVQEGHVDAIELRPVLLLVGEQFAEPFQCIHSGIRTWLGLIVCFILQSPEKKPLMSSKAEDRVRLEG